MIEDDQKFVFGLKQVRFHFYSYVTHVVRIALGWYTASDSICSRCIMCLAPPQVYLLYKPLSNLQYQLFLASAPK